MRSTALSSSNNGQGGVKRTSAVLFIVENATIKWRGTEEARSRTVQCHSEARISSLCSFALFDFSLCRSPLSLSCLTSTEMWCCQHFHRSSLLLPHSPSYTSAPLTTPLRPFTSVAVPPLHSSSSSPLSAFFHLHLHTTRSRLQPTLVFNFIAVGVSHPSTDSFVLSHPIQPLWPTQRSASAPLLANRLPFPPPCLTPLRPS